MLFTTRIPPSRWCISFQDLVRFRAQVAQAIGGKRIVPTQVDDFDVMDRTHGPTIYTVNQQFIKPVTADAGNTSWALMLHMDGLDCDVFITHGWREGVFELLDKVINSWPRGARGVYCCVLSNPQNLDIAELVSEPSKSPFAQALQSARWMLVVPNRHVSIYTRIWCSYEAFLAYRWQKVIYTAKAPIRGLWRFILALALTYISTCALAIYVVQFRILHDLPTAELYAHHTRIELVHSLAISVCIIVENANLVRMLNFFCAFVAGLNSGLVFNIIFYSCTERAGKIDEDVSITFKEPWFVCDHRGTFSICGTLRAIFWVAVSLLSEAGIAWRADQLRETDMLRCHFSGRVVDAQSSVKADKDMILAEISASSLEKEVDQAVDVLIRAGMSSAGLQNAEKHGVDVTGAGYCKYAQAMAAWATWFSVAFAIWREGTFKSLGTDWWPFLLICTLLEAATYVLSLFVLPLDRRQFSYDVGSSVIFFGFYLPVHLAQVLIMQVCNATVREYTIGASFTFACLHGPLSVSLSLMGPGVIASFPVIGPRILHLIYFPKKACSRCSWRCRGYAPRSRSDLGTEMVAMKS